jgi:hypothetical protein
MKHEREAYSVVDVAQTLMGGVRGTGDQYDNPHLMADWLEWRTTRIAKGGGWADAAPSDYDTAVYDMARAALRAYRTQTGCVRAFIHDCQCPKCAAKPAHETRGWEPK